MVLLAGCIQQAPTMQNINVTIQVDGGQKNVQIPTGSTAQMALEKAGITAGPLDRVNPPGSTEAKDQMVIQVTRVREEFEVEEKTIPFERQTVHNESLPEGQTMLIQPGENGANQITYRKLYEDNTQVSRTEFKTVTLKEPRSEIVMVGVQTPFTAVPISGKLAYITGGNAWVMNENTGIRKPLVTSGDLDGRIFSLSNDGKWLLFTRKSEKDPAEEINTLWVVNTENESPHAVDLNIKNVINFAAWVPGAGLSVAYSTVEPRSTAPGWQANNDLQIATLGAGGANLREKEIVTANSGGIYGWWGTTFAYSPDGTQLAYARPDSVGLVDVENGQLSPVINLIPYQTGSDWAWVPGISWSPDGEILYTVIHSTMTGLSSDESSPLFDLAACVVKNNTQLTLSSQTGMFAYPTVSELLPDNRYQIAYLQAIFPDKSQTSRYRLVIADRDGSNRAVIFPPEGSSGLEPHKIVWGPAEKDGTILIAVIQQGNLWLLDSTGTKSQQITGDGLVSRVDWK
jgi:WD40 repeat protein